MGGGGEGGFVGGDWDGYVLIAMGLADISGKLLRVVDHKVPGSPNLTRQPNIIDFITTITSKTHSTPYPPPPKNGPTPPPNLAIGPHTSRNTVRPIRPRPNLRRLPARRSFLQTRQLLHTPLPQCKDKLTNKSQISGPLTQLFEIFAVSP